MNWNMGNNRYLPHYDAPTLHGEQDANSFAIGPNSQIFLPDAKDDIIWWIRTDNAGVKTVIALDVTPHKTPQPVDLNALVARIDQLEEQINGKLSKSSKQQQQQRKPDETGQ